MTISSKSGKSDIANRLGNLQQSYKQHLPLKIVSMETQWQAIKAEMSVTRLSELYQIVHNLSGSGGTFGAVAVSKVARELEQALKSLLTEPEKIPSLSSAIQQQIDALFKHLSDIADQWQPSDISYIQPVKDEVDQRSGNLVYLVEDDEFLARDLIAKLENANFEVRHFAKLSEFAAAMMKKTPTVIIMDIVFNEDDIAGAEVISKLKKQSEVFPPIIFISVRDDIEARLAAVRAGATRYYCKPLDMKQFLPTMELLTTRTAARPYRILLIDDDKILLEYYTAVLVEAGMDVKAVSQPLDSLKALKEFKPDIVVTDVHMPSCTGPELVQVIRQDDDWAQLGIIFLSNELDLTTQLEAMRLGGDDFLVKPVEPWHLVSAVSARAKSSRASTRINKDLKNALRESEFLLVTLDQHAIVSTADIAGQITFVNDKFCEISGYDRKELLQLNHRRLKSTYHPDSFYQTLWHKISQGKVWNDIFCNAKKDGELYWVDSTIVPFLDDDGKPYKYVSVSTDVTALQEKEERLYRSQIFANIGNWDWNIQSGDLYWSDHLWTLFGYDQKIIETTYENFIDAIYPEDQQKVVNAIMNCVEHGADFNIEHRVVWPDGSVHWMQESGNVVRKDDGRPMHMLGVVRDITERIQAGTRLRKYNEILELIAKGGALKEVLQSIIVHAEAMLSGSICSIFLLDKSGKYLNEGAASNLPDFFNKFIKGLEIGIGIGSDGETAYSGKRVIVNDIQLHPNWAPYRDVALKAGLRACWSEPVFSSSGAVLGTFAVYYPAPHEPDSEELKLIAELAQVAGIVGERDLSQLALLRAKEEAEQASRAKSLFLSSMSHELRTPMNAIIGFAQLLQMENSPPLNKSQLESVNEILVGGYHLLELINEVLDLARIETGRIDFSIENIDLAEVINEALLMVQPSTQKRGIEMSLARNNEEMTLEELLKQNIVAMIDRSRFRQVMLNLLSNAVKYNCENGKIIIAIDDLENSRYRISVTDTGPGLSREKQAKLFKSFNRLGAESTDIEGTGIGLVITKNIIELMGGKIGVESKQGAGSTFWVDLPIESELPGGQHRLDNLAMKQSESVTHLDQEYSVLYIEDNPANLRLVSHLLGRRPNIHLWSAQEPLLGLELAMEHQPDLILLDINLPEINGYEVLQHLRQREATREIPVIAISANAMVKDIERALEAGFDEYITKPINVDALLNAVETRLKDKVK